jgi:hypothetical protein
VQQRGRLLVRLPKTIEPQPPQVRSIHRESLNIPTCSSQEPQHAESVAREHVPLKRPQFRYYFSTAERRTGATAVGWPITVGIDGGYCGPLPRRAGSSHFRPKKRHSTRGSKGSGQKMRLDRTAWEEGFTAGESGAPASSCPYPAGTAAAWSWHSSYIEGHV